MLGIRIYFRVNPFTAKTQILTNTIKLMQLSLAHFQICKLIIYEKYENTLLNRLSNHFLIIINITCVTN